VILDQWGERRHSRASASSPNTAEAFTLRRVSRELTMPNILVVCTANICRSPVGEALLRKRLDALGHGDWTVSSAGTWAAAGFSATSYNTEILAREGIDISGHKSQPVTKELLAETDLVLCMTSGHAESLRAEFADEAHKVFQLTAMSGARYDVADPYGGSRKSYQGMVEEIDRMVDLGIERIVALAEKLAKERPEDAD